MGVNGEALWLHAVYFYYKSRENLQVTRAAPEHKWNWDKIIITIVQSYTEKNITFELPFTLLLMLPTSNNTDGNKLVIFYSITSYYGDNYILQVKRTHGKFMSEKLHA